EPQPSAEFAPIQSPTPPRRSPWAPHLVLATAASLFVLLALGLVIKIRSKDGSETTINVPPGAKVLIEQHRGEGEYQQPQGGGLTGARDTRVKGQDASPPRPTPESIPDVGTRTSLGKKPSDLQASNALRALRRDRIPFQALVAAGDGD